MTLEVHLISMEGSLAGASEIGMAQTFDMPNDMCVEKFAALFFLIWGVRGYFRSLQL